MIIRSPKEIWGSKLATANKDFPEPFNLRLKPEATDEEKAEFEDYMMNLSGGWELLKNAPVDLRKPYYTWEGKVVELESLKDRELKPAEETPFTYDMA